MNYEAPWWLPGGNLQTIWSAKLARSLDPALAASPPQFRRERWVAPDGDFVDVDFLVDTPAPSPALGSARDSVALVKPDGKTLVVMFHGLEGSSQSHYALAMAAWCQQHQLAFAVPHFRGCSGELNHAPRAYHSGDFEEIGWILQRLKIQHSAAQNGPLGGQTDGQTGRPTDRAIVALGVSLGGNALLRWAQEAGAEASKTVASVASVCSPIDLAASGHAIGRGFNRLVYTRMFLNSMKPKALQKLAQHPGLFDRAAMLASRDLYEFDNIVTAPIHGFRDTEDYWSRASAQPHLHQIRIPALVVNALNDPFVPAASLPGPSQVGAHVRLWQPSQGGHVGFAAGGFPGHLRTIPETVGGWLVSHAK